MTALQLFGKRMTFRTPRIRVDRDRICEVGLVLHLRGVLDFFVQAHPCVHGLSAVEHGDWPNKRLEVLGRYFFDTSK